MTAEPKRDRAAVTRERVIHAAAQAFARRGYMGASLDEIVAIAGVTKGALYFHFDSKEALAHAVARHFTSGDAAIEDALDPHKSAMRDLLDLSFAWADGIRRDPRVRGAIRLAIEFGIFQEPMHYAYDNWIGITRRLLHKAQKEGDIRADLDIDPVASHVVSAFTGVQVVSQVYSKHEDFPSRLAHMWHLLLPGIVPPDRLAHFQEQLMVASET